jgi:hypothetical protein
MNQIPILQIIPKSSLTEALLLSDEKYEAFLQERFTKYQEEVDKERRIKQQALVKIFQDELTACGYTRVGITYSKQMPNHTRQVRIAIKFGYAIFAAEYVVTIGDAQFEEKLWRNNTRLGNIDGKMLDKEFDVYDRVRTECYNKLRNNGGK